MPFGLCQNDEFNRQQLEAWFQAVKPLVLVSFSKEVTSLSLDRVGKIQKLYKVVGIPVFRMYAGLPVVIIPHIDPGRDRYNADSPLLRRIMFLSWVAVIGICHELLSALENGMQDRRDLCHVAVDCFDSPRFQDLREALDSAKSDWSESYKRAFPSSSFKRIADLRAANAPKASPLADRKDQLEDLWRHPDARLSKTFETKEDFVAWGMNMKEGKHVFGSVLHRISTQNPYHPNRASLSGVAPPGAVDDSWMLDPELVDAANKRKAAQLTANRPDKLLTKEAIPTSPGQTFGTKLATSQATPWTVVSCMAGGKLPVALETTKW